MFPGARSPLLVLEGLAFALQGKREKAAEAWERWLDRPPASAAEEDVERVRALVAEIRGRRKE